MEYQQLHQRYGSHIARRVQAELNHDEFALAPLDDLVAYLETRADKAQKDYLVRLDDPLGKLARENADRAATDELHRRWRDAEELAYLVSVTAAIGLNGHGHRAAG